MYLRGYFPTKDPLSTYVRQYPLSTYCVPPHEIFNSTVQGNTVPYSSVRHLRYLLETGKPAHLVRMWVQ